MEVSEAIKEAWDNADSVDQACDNLKKMMDADRDLHNAVINPHVDEIIRGLINKSKQSDRRHIWSRTTTDWQRPTSPDERAKVLAKINTATIMDMRLRSGKRLADAMKDEVANERDYYSHMSEHMGDKARFFGIIADKMKDGKTVAQVFKTQDLEAMRVAA